MRYNESNYYFHGNKILIKLDSNYRIFFTPLVFVFVIKCSSTLFENM